VGQVELWLGAGIFSHEKFKVYDKELASVASLAEGNGRYPEQDHRRFLGMAEASAVKAVGWRGRTTITVCAEKCSCDF